MSSSAGPVKTASRKRSKPAGGGEPPGGMASRAFDGKRDVQRAAAGPTSDTAPRVPMPVQRQVTVSEPDDAHEREADAVASRVAAGGLAGPISPLGPAGDEGTEPPVQGLAPEAAPPAEELQRAAATPEQTAEGAEPPVQRLAQRQTPPPENRKPEGERRRLHRLAQRAMAPMEDPKKAQRATPAGAPPRAEELQRAAPETTGAAREPGDGLVQASDAGGGGSGGGGAGGAPAPAAASAIAAPGPGRPIAPATRSTLESRMGFDLAGVRVHDDSAAHDAARSIESRAFTHQDDIWLARGESQDDLRLMAHEATHVAQQRGGVQRSAVQRAEAGELPPGDKSSLGEIDTTAGHKTMKLKKINVPKVKEPYTTPHLPLTIRKGPRPEDTQQRELWETEVGSLGSRIRDKVAGLSPVKDNDGTEVYFFKHKDGYVIGSDEVLEEKVRRPTWDKEGRLTFFQVDHQWELQLGGGDDRNNVWLWEGTANQSSGSKIYHEINRRIDAFLKTVKVKDKPDVATAREEYDIQVETVGDELPIKGEEYRYYTAEQVRQGKSLEPLEPVREREITRLRGTNNRISIYSTPSGGRRIEVAIKDGESTGTYKWGNLQVTKILYGENPEQRQLKGFAFGDDPWLTKVTFDPGVPILEIPGVEWGGYLSGKELRSILKEALKLKAFSAVDLDEAEVDPEQGIVAAGRLLPSIPLFENVPIDLRIGARGVYLSKVFSGGEIKLPGPIKIRGSTLEIQLGTAGLAVLGEVPFEIERLGSGRVYGEGELGAKVGFALGGEFEFDTDLFKPAQIKVWYRDWKFGGAGKLGIPEGKIRGIKSATLDVTFDEDRIEAQGNVEVTFKGVQRGSLSVVYDRAEGLQIAGTLELSPDIPGVKSGKLDASLKQKPEGGWSLGGGIRAEVGIPGLTATITGAYQDGIFQLEGTTGYEKGFLKGTVTIGATNRAVGEDGRPTGEDSGKLSAYGGGAVTVRFAPWLQGTVGLRIKPDGGIVITGKVGLPSTLEIFSEKKLSRNIFTLNFDIPIIGFSVLGQRVGIFATVGGGLDADAGIGPGQLRQAELAVTYDPADEAATSVVGAAKLVIPAHAGLRLFVRGGIGAGIPVVSATAGLEVGGALGIEGALESDLEVNWTPVTGLVIDAVLSAYAQPKFKFDVTGFVEVTVDYFVGSSTLYDEKWKLAAVEYGSDLTFGLKLPVHYEEGKQFDVSLSDVEFQYPQIDAMDLLDGLVKQLV